METLSRLERPENHRFTFTYAQPAAYHFCQDSVIFPRVVAELLRQRVVTPEFRALDVCSGCGVIGLELAHLEPRLRQFDFMEIQEDFRTSFEGNVLLTGRDPQRFVFLNENYLQLNEASYAKRYDLIVANPPYFFPGEGPLSPSAFQNRCRFFLDGSLRDLAIGVAHALAPGGEGFLLVKSGRTHGRHAIRDLRLWLAAVDATVTLVADIRGTPLVQITKH